MPSAAAAWVVVFVVETVTIGPPRQPLLVPPISAAHSSLRRPWPHCLGVAEVVAAVAVGASGADSVTFVAQATDARPVSWTRVVPNIVDRTPPGLLQRAASMTNCDFSRDAMDFSS